MKVLLVNPKTYPVRVSPVGLRYIAAVLEKDGHVGGIFGPPPYEKSFEEELKKFELQLIGFTYTSPQSALVNELAKKLDADYADFYITTPYPSTELFKIAEENGWIDVKWISVVWSMRRR